MQTDNLRDVCRFSVRQGLFQTLLADRSTALHFSYVLTIILVVQCIDVCPFEILWFPLIQEEIHCIVLAMHVTWQAWLEHADVCRSDDDPGCHEVLLLYYDITYVLSPMGSQLVPQVQLLQRETLQTRQGTSQMKMRWQYLSAKAPTPTLRVDEVTSRADQSLRTSSNNDNDVVALDCCCILMKGD